MAVRLRAHVRGNPPSIHQALMMKMELISQEADCDGNLSGVFRGK